MNNEEYRISLGLSPCPNDTFAFHHLLKEADALPFTMRPVIIEDVETLNQMALRRELDVTKVSFHTFGLVMDDYILLRSGSALGWGCGPMLLAKKPIGQEQLSESRIAIPGRYTTAALLLKLFLQGAPQLVTMNFADIPQAILNGAVDAGVIIHETRFTYSEKGLICLQDLGQWWEEETGLPIPLGGIIAKRSLGIERLREVNSAIKTSILAAWENPKGAYPFIKGLAQELDERVIKSHIDLYVTDYTLDIGKEGEGAVRFLMAIGQQKDVFPSYCDKDLFLQNMH